MVSLSHKFDRHCICITYSLDNVSYSLFYGAIRRDIKLPAICQVFDSIISRFLAVAGQRLSTKDTIKKVLDNFDLDAVVVKDSDSESDVVVVSPPSPKPDIVVEPVNSLRKVVDLVEETKSDWIEHA